MHKNMRRQLSYDEKLRLPLIIDHLLLGIDLNEHYRIVYIRIPRQFYLMQLARDSHLPLAVQDHYDWFHYISEILYTP